MSGGDIYVLFLPGAYATATDYDIDATLKYPDSTFPTVNHLFYDITAIAVDASTTATAGATLSVTSPTGNINPSTTSNY